MKTDLCQQCATKHGPEIPHNWESLFWQYWHYKNHGRWPTIKDAMAHCSEPMRKAWIATIRKQAEEEQGSIREAAMRLVKQLEEENDHHQPG